MNIINLQTGEPFDAAPRTNHRELAVEGASSVSLRQRNLLGLRGAMMGGCGKKLPYDEQLEYLESNRSQYIDTGILSSSTVSFDMFGCFTDGKANTQLLGSRGPHYYELEAYGSSRFFWQYGKNEYQYAGSEWCNGEIAEWKNEYGLLTTPYFSLDGTSQSFSNTYTIYLFGMNNKGDADRFASGKIKSCRFFNTSGDIANFIAVLKDGVPCMYDTVGGGFYYNLYSGHQFGYKTSTGVIVDPI